MSEYLVTQALSLLQEADRFDLLTLAKRPQVRPVRSAAHGVAVAVFACSPTHDDEGSVEEACSRGGLRTQRKALSVRSGQRGARPASVDVFGTQEEESDLSWVHGELRVEEKRSGIYCL
ncbi:hypothetical protein NDU88_002888 [Pleurodeles waltl]|uniref:Uncharacterized protein n=1 Tax=Pleurodeles waltl TaxID=8319 RepID=A0AAV7W4M8_PLEWA|nr:hypothetical protein NDU88_002888 [Pleurodeles waltl]